MINISYLPSQSVFHLKLNTTEKVLLIFFENNENGKGKWTCNK